LAGKYSNTKIKGRKQFKPEKKFKVKVGIAYDNAFNFYYQYNLDLLKRLGANLVYFSPVKDKRLPEVDAVYLGGGFPEGFLKQLAVNQDFINDLKYKVEKGLPTYAECGGLMYLSNKIIDKNGREYSMTGIIPGETEMTESLQNMGYTGIKAVENNILMNKGEEARGHSFHYSRIRNFAKNITFSYKTTGGNREGYIPAKNVLASYIHLHFGSNPILAVNFLEKAEKYKNSLQ
ncbi:MAG: cobyrinic acid a,c-diamide synthase, partial [Bacillota bacterium]